MKSSVKKYGKWAVITGGSSGIGLEFAKLLARKGHDIVIVARNATQLETAKTAITTQSKVDVRTISMDLTREGAVSSLLQDVSDLDVGIAVLNAGMETSGNFNKTPLQVHQDLVALNVRTPMEMAHAFGAQFIEKRRGGIIFVSSLFGYQGVPLVAAYAASKAYILSLGEALSVELKRFGVDVTVLSPGLTDTPMPAAMPVNFSKLPMPNMSPRRAAKAGLYALGRKVSIVPGFVNKMFAWENRLLPRWFPIKMFGALVRYAFKKDKAAQYLYKR